jgi:hypothetical protein
VQAFIVLSPLAWKNTITRVEKYPSLAWKNTHRSRGKIPIARVEKYPSLAWKNTHRSRGKININSVQESTSIVRQNQYIAQYGLLKMVIARNEAISVSIFHSGLPPGRS